MAEGRRMAMSGYKGYTYNPTDKKVISPLGEPIATLLRYLSDGVWFHTHIPGMKADGYETVDEAVRDLADQHRALTGTDADELSIQAGEARTIIIGTVENLHVNQNELPIRMTGEMRERIEEAVNGADAVTLKRVLKEWIPQSFLGAGISALLSMLGL